MRLLRRMTIATMVAGATIAAAAAGTASAATLADLSYTVKNLPGGSPFVVQYNGGVFQGLGGDAQAQSGGIGTVTLANNAVFLFSSSPLSATIDHWLSVGSAPVTEVVTLPAGGTATVVNSITQKQFTLGNGAFSIPTGVGALGATSRPAGLGRFSARAMRAGAPRASRSRAARATASSSSASRTQTCGCSRSQQCRAAQAAPTCSGTAASLSGARNTAPRWTPCGPTRRALTSCWRSDP